MFMDLTLTLAVRNLDLTAEFYGDILQMTIDRFVPAPGHPSVLLLSCGDAAVVFRETETLEATHPALFQNLDRHPKGVGVTLEFSLKSLRPLAKNIDRRGLHVLYELEDEEFGRRELWVHDPDGYLVILAEEPDDEKS
jgi:catechol 2,3-dioxygenase-like lactoylglutathione lyase family enzyme